MTAPKLDIQRLSANIDALSTYTLPDVPWTRRAFTPTYAAARRWLAGKFTHAGLAVNLDPGGNLIGRREGSHPLPPIMTGSHCDTVVGGGRFDGILGLLAGLEIAQTIHDRGIVLRHPFELVDFLSEEPSDYGISCVGSRALQGTLGPAMLASKNHEGETLAEAMRRVGASPEQLAKPLRQPGSAAAFIELHIEQGPILEARDLPIGIVTQVVGIRRLAITVHGRPDHAGTTPMDLRRDALVGAASILRHAYEQASTALGGPHYVVATIGRILVTPNVANAVPGKVELTLEVRTDSDAILDGFASDLLATVQPDLAALRLTATVEALSFSRPTSFSPIVADAILRASQDLGYAGIPMTSGAGHDAVYMSTICPAGMIFVPCREGRSHCPEEWIEPHQLAAGAQLLFETILDLDRTLWSALTRCEGAR